MRSNRRIGIIDIGSNSIRLVVYEENEQGAYRVIDESKSSARLSDKISGDGSLRLEELDGAVDTLLRFKMLCDAHQVSLIRAVATAAIRNAHNHEEIIDWLRAQSGLPIEIISGEDEARYGFIGMINTIDVDSGLLIDIGGGSTELTLFQNRAIVQSVSFPFGAVNTTKQYTRDGEVDEAGIRAIHNMVMSFLERIPWIKQAEDLPLIGLGGTIRSVSKIEQRMIQYSLPLTHHYEMKGSAVNHVMEEITKHTVEKRKKIDGLDKNRADLIAAGIIILQTIFRAAKTSHYIISGSGLRDGIFFETILPENPIVDDVLDHSVQNLLSLHPLVSQKHVEHVQALGVSLFDQLDAKSRLDERSRRYLSTAALLYRIGVTVHYYQYEKHTFYLMAHSRIDGLSHRETLITALVAAYQTKSRTRKLYMEHIDILSEEDLQTAVKLGTLLRIAVALDRSETQPITRITLERGKSGHELLLHYARYPQIEQKEVEALLKEMKPEWDISIKARAIPDQAQP